MKVCVWTLVGIAASLVLSVGAAPVEQHALAKRSPVMGCFSNYPSDVDDTVLEMNGSSDQRLESAMQCISVGRWMRQEIQTELEKELMKEEADADWVEEMQMAMIDAEEYVERGEIVVKMIQDAQRKRGIAERAQQRNGEAVSAFVEAQEEPFSLGKCMRVRGLSKEASVSYAESVVLSRESNEADAEANGLMEGIASAPDSLVQIVDRISKRVP